MNQGFIWRMHVDCQLSDSLGVTSPVSVRNQIIDTNLRLNFFIEIYRTPGEQQCVHFRRVALQLNCHIVVVLGGYSSKLVISHPCLLCIIVPTDVVERVCYFLGGFISISVSSGHHVPNYISVFVWWRWRLKRRFGNNLALEFVESPYLLPRLFYFFAT